MAIRTAIRDAIKARLGECGYKVVPMVAKVNSYQMADYPLAKVIFDGLSSVSAEYFHSKKVRQDGFTLLVIPFCSIDDFENAIDEQIERIDSIFIELEETRKFIDAPNSDKFVSIKIGDCEAIQPESTSDTSKPYALLKVSGSISYVVE